MRSPILLSVIMPTKNRPNLLKKALQSIVKQNFPKKSFEIIVVDNGSTIETKKVVGSFVKEIPNLSYIREDISGLHACRHKGQETARADILVFTDDDIEAFPTWLEGVSSAFEDNNVALVGGKNLPKFESSPPKWILDMWKKDSNGHRILGYLSILDLGHRTKEITPYHVYGCNFSIRNSVLLESKGFHPDAFPQKLIRFRGDGESYVASHINAKGFKTIYSPEASISHWVPNSRTTIEYFCLRAYNQGISDSYTSFRSAKNTIRAANENAASDGFRARINGMLNLTREKAFAKIPWVVLRHLIGYACRGNLQLITIKRKITFAYKAGYAFHQKMFKEDPKLREWVLRENYMGKNGMVPE